ncbi:MAG: M10 family metallopeptidase C-terminal domain-containing protein [Candidatus Methylopumilus sp.]
MATIVFNQAARMDNPYTIQSTSTNFVSGGYFSYMTASQGAFSASFHGAITYSYQYGYITQGRIFEYVISHNGAVEYTVENISPELDALLIQGFLSRADTLGLLRYTTSGDDDITGTASNDILEGGAGADTLHGGTGADTFKYLSIHDSTLVATDTISDFTHGIDKIDLSSFSGANNLTFTNTTPSINGLWYQQVNVNTFVFADTDGDGNADFKIQLTGNINLFNLDFIGTTVASSLFTNGVETINFNLISQASYISGTQYDALGGNDVVMLPSDITKAQAAGYDPSHTFYGGAGDDSITGGALNDIVDGGVGADTLIGSEGNDTLNGGAGLDTMYGGVGDDTYLVDNVGDFVSDSDGANDAVILQIASGTYIIGSGIDNVSISNISATINIIGNEANNTISGNNGVNKLEGLDGNDTITGGAGNDILDGGIGADEMNGGAGSDTYFVDDADDIVVETDANSSTGGTDTVNSTISFSLIDSAPNVENLTLIGNDNVSATGNVRANTITGNDSNNLIYGGGGTAADTLKGLNGNDTYEVEIVKSGTGAAAIAKFKDTVIEAANMGNDSINLIGSVLDLTKATTITLVANVENINASATGATLLNFIGSAADNRIFGNDAANILDGAAGLDDLAGGLGDDTYVVDSVDDLVTEGLDEGADTIQIWIATGNEDESYVLAGNVENAILLNNVAFNLTGNNLSNKLIGNAAANVIDGGLQADTMAGGAGNDSYHVDDFGDIVTELAAGGIDTVLSSLDYSLLDTDGSGTNGGNVENLILTGTAVTGTGNAAANYMTGNDASNTLTGNAGNDTVDGGVGADILIGGIGNDLYLLDDVADSVIEDGTSAGGIDTVKLNENYNSSSRNLEVGIENLDASAMAAGITLQGNLLANVLTGGTGDDTLDGGVGVDVLKGGSGSDNYQVSLKSTGTVGSLMVAIEDSIVELADDGDEDKVTLLGSAGLTKASTIALGLNLESLDASQTFLTKLNLNGNSLDNDLTGNDEANIIDGGTGADQMTGGLGDDTYVVDNLNDTVSEQSGEGDADNIQVKIALAGESYMLSDAVENGALLNSVAFNLTGNSLGNKLTGNAAANVLDGGAGVDVMIGAAGNDTYIVDDIGDVVTELAAGGIDTVRSSFAYSIASAANLENITLTGIDNTDATGNALANMLIGNIGINNIVGAAGNDTLDGGEGADNLDGGQGDDTYIVDGAGDVVTELVGAGADTIQSTITYSLLDTDGLGGSNVENLTLIDEQDINGIGNALNNKITGNAGNNELDGGAGLDVLAGGFGDDTYLVDIVQTTTNMATARVAIQDSIIEATVAGLDGDTLQLRGEFIHSNATTLTLALNLENLHANLTGLTKLNINGNTLNNRILGNNAANIISGLAGDDTIIAGDGNDLLDGGTGLDSMDGGDGDDIFMVDNSDDTATGGNGVDTIKITIATANDSYNLEASVENGILLNNVAFTLVGNTLSNFLIGNAAANTLDGDNGNDTLDGGAGIDTMFGGAGNDVYIVDQVLDEVFEGLGQGTDTVQAKVSYSIADSAEVENLTLLAGVAISATGNFLGNIITGNSAANILDGGEGADVMAGGLGNDIYIIDDVSDTVTEALNEGTDTVKLTASYNGISRSAEANSENLDASLYAGGITLTGNTLANILIGGVGNDTLEGGAGADILKGGLGDDQYEVNLKTIGSGLNIIASLEDTVTELAGQGTDTLKLHGGAGANNLSTILLGANLEYLDASDTGSILLNLTGNDLNNRITGNDGANVISGGKGVDTLIGGDGSDTYVLDQEAELLNITELDNEGVADLLQIGYANTSATNAKLVDLGNTNLAYIENVSFASTGTGLFNIVGNDLDNSLVGNVSRNNIQGGAGNDILNGGAGADTLAGGADNDTYVVDNLLDMVVELEDEGLDSVESSVTYTLSSNIENLTLTGATVINGAGNSLANNIQGNNGANNLSGAGGDDTLNGGTGNDILNGGAGNDSLIGGMGTDTAIFSGSADFYDITVDNGVYTISGLDGADTLQEIELVKFGSGAAVNIASLIQNQPSAAKAIAALDSGTSWLLPTLTYSFMTSAPTYDTAHTGFREMSLGEKAAVRAALTQYSSVTNIDFVEASDTNDVTVQLRFGTEFQSDDYLLGYAYYPDLSGVGFFDQKSGDVWLNNSSIYNIGSTLSELAPGEAIFTTIVHEVGHALGLKHPGNYGEGDEPPYLSQAEDTTSLTVMSYYPTQHSDIYIENGSFLDYSYTVEPSTLMLYDIAAIQSIYGENTDFNSGNTTYTFSYNQPILQTIWDGGGIDTIDVSNGGLGFIRPSIVDLREGHFSSIGMGDNLGITTPNGSLIDLTFFLFGYNPNDLANSIGKYGYNGEDNLAIAYGTVIENAIGGLSNDILLGNASDNQLKGNAGNDLLSGSTGDDSLLGGEGLDTLWGGSGSDVFVFDSYISFQNNIDVISDFEVGIDKIYLDMGVYQQLATGSLADEAFNTGNFSMAQDTSDRIIYNQQTGGLYYDFNGNTGLGPVQFATLQGVTGLSSADFIVA